jgi:hypothetical protein
MNPSRNTVEIGRGRDGYKQVRLNLDGRVSEITLFDDEYVTLEPVMYGASAALAVVVKSNYGDYGLVTYFAHEIVEAAERLAESADTPAEAARQIVEGEAA